MKLVVDANVIISCLIKEGKSIELLLNFFFEIYAPEFILKEISNHKYEILSKLKRSEKEFAEAIDKIKEVAKLIPDEELIEPFAEAEKISPDPDDALYFALALKLNCPIWSNDKRLKEQNKIKIYSTEDLINKFSK